MESDEFGAIVDVSKRFEQTWNSHDVDSFADLFSKDADYVNFAGDWWKGQRAIREGHKETQSTLFKNGRLSIQKNEIRMMTPEVAVCRSLWAIEGLMNPDGKPQPMRKGILLHVLHKRNSHWSIIASQNTDIIANS